MLRRHPAFIWLQAFISLIHVLTGAFKRVQALIWDRRFNGLIRYTGYDYRLYLAALHYNENKVREQAVTSSGDQQYSIHYPKYIRKYLTVKTSSMTPQRVLSHMPCKYYPPEE